jgi:hypothetical protein
MLMLDELGRIAEALANTPLDALAMLVSLVGLGLAGFPIYAMWSIVRQRGSR